MTFTPKLSIMQQVFGNSYVDIKHEKYVRCTTTSTSNLGIMQPGFGKICVWNKIKTYKLHYDIYIKSGPYTTSIW